MNSSTKTPTQMTPVEAWADREGALAEAVRCANRANLRLGVVVVALVAVCGFLYESSSVRMYVREVDANGVALRNTTLTELTDVSDVMKRDAVTRFFRSLRSAAVDGRHQSVLNATALALTAGNSEAHGAVAAHMQYALPERRKQEIEATVVAHRLTEERWQAEITEISPGRQPLRYTAYATLDVAVRADRNVELNPFGIFVRSYSIDSLGGAK